MRSASEVAAMNCPVCQVPLAMSDRQGIEIDYCPQCRGVWLDRGELDKIIERTPTAAAPQARTAPVAPQAPPRPQPGYGDDYRRHDSGSFGHGYGHKPHKRHKHWLEEIFD